MESTGKKNTMTGEVVSNKMDKTVVVKVERKSMHATFKKVIKRTKKYKVHDEKNQCQIGDLISICESRPLSKTKRWRLLEIINRAVSGE